MSDVNYNIYDLVSNLVMDGKDISEISHELNLEKSFVATVLKRARNEYILSFDEKKYENEMVHKIDILLNRKK